MRDEFVQLEISTHGEIRELRLLLDWFKREEALRGHVKAVYSPVQTGQMGGALELLAITVSSGGTAMAVARVLSAWLTHRRSEIVVTIKNDSGMTVQFDGKRVDATAVLQNIESLVDSQSVVEMDEQ